MSSRYRQTFWAVMLPSPLHRFVILSKPKNPYSHFYRLLFNKEVKSATRLVSHMQGDGSMTPNNAFALNNT
jgi:hypothetical protein